MELKKAAKVHYLEPELLTVAGISIQGFTTRHEGVSRPPYNSLNLGTNTLDTPHNVKGNQSLLARAMGARMERFITVNQVHGTDLLVIDAPNNDFSHFRTIECDGIITNQPGVLLGIGVADCIPILLLDPVHRVAAALHAGWKGTAANIVTRGVTAMTEMFGTRPAEILAAVGPGIGSCCYEVDGVVREAFEHNGASWDVIATSRGEGKWGLDLARANYRQLLEAGLEETKIETADRCVSCDHDLFFSHRRDRGVTGRQMGFIMLKG
jgi:YfiH family protein